MAGLSLGALLGLGLGARQLALVCGLQRACEGLEGDAGARIQCDRLALELVTSTLGDVTVTKTLAKVNKPGEKQSMLMPP